MNILIKFFKKGSQTFKQFGNLYFQESAKLITQQKTFLRLISQLLFFFIVNLQKYMALLSKFN